MLLSSKLWCVLAYSLVRLTTSMHSHFRVCSCSCALQYESFEGGFDIAHNVNPQDNKAIIALANVVPRPGYTISLTSMSDTSDVLPHELSVAPRGF
ncbi:hypothetical protein B0H10DRAFT_2033851, partial [Mycena sp. CBHHK59/15]